MLLCTYEPSVSACVTNARRWCERTDACTHNTLHSAQTRWQARGRVQAQCRRSLSVAATSHGALAATSAPATGTCYLVGAGPGDPELLTVKAARLLATAQTVVYDDLGAAGVLELAPSSAERIYVGKRGGQTESWQQADIDRLLVDLCAHQGRSVVRLKGGCPSVFSRVHSELAALRAAGVPTQLVPGVTSATAAPLLAGFPLTHPVHSTSFTVLTGHDVDAADWPTLAQLPTLVILMGGRALPAIVERLLAAGREPDTQVHVIRAAGTPEQAVWRGTLQDIVTQTHGAKLSPCIVVVSRMPLKPP